MNTKKWIVSFGGSGLVPVGPGTSGSLAAAGMVLLAWYAFDSIGQLSVLHWNLLLAVCLAFACWLSIHLGGWACMYFGQKDPQAFVLDEVAGICLTMLFQPLFRDWRESVVVAAAFVAFRIFDIAKPWPARQLETMPAGWGILFDDLAAAVYGNILCQIVLRLVL